MYSRRRYDARGADRDEVPGQVGLELAQVVHGDLSRLDRGHHEPADEAQDLAAPGPADGARGVGVLPHEHVPEGNDRGADRGAHEHVAPAEVQADLGQAHREGAHEEAKDHDDDLGDDEDLAAVGIRIDVGLADACMIYIVCYVCLSCFIIEDFLKMLRYVLQCIYFIVAYYACV